MSCCYNRCLEKRWGLSFRYNVMVNQLIQELEKYQLKGSFIFKQTSRLSEVCNIPTQSDLAGLYLFYDNDTNELLYVGISGRTNKDGILIFRKDGLRGRFLKRSEEHTSELQS